MIKRTDSFYIEELRKLGLALDIEKVKDYSRFHWKLGIVVGYIVSSIFMSIGILGLLVIFLAGFLTDPSSWNRDMRICFYKKVSKNAEAL